MLGGGRAVELERVAGDDLLGLAEENLHLRAFGRVSPASAALLSLNPAFTGLSLPTRPDELGH